MGQALYRKYRSKNLDEIVGQEHITQALSRAIASGHISHAYLFTGPRGVGKTSIARILAYEVNKLPYDESATHLDIIEIDAASNRRIDEIRDLRDKVHIAPSSAIYKVYIVDEVHMLTREAFNALLKTLEEPPAHAIFILATTEAHKLPETIVSRTQHYSFRPIETAKVVNHLRFVADSEEIQISDEALLRIAEHGGGSFRDSISLLDQVRNYAENIDVDDVDKILGVASQQSVDDIVSVITKADVSGLMKSLTLLTELGVQPIVLADQLSTRLQKELFNPKTSLGNRAILQTLTQLVDVTASPKPQLSLELCLLELLFTVSEPEESPITTSQPTTTKVTKPQKNASSVKNSDKSMKQPAPHKPQSQESKVLEPKVPETEDTSNPTVDTNQVAQESSAFSVDQWQEVLMHIKKSHNTMYGILRMAVPTVSDEALTLTFGFAFHQKRANDVKNKQIISDAILELFGLNISVNCEVGEIETPTQPSKSVTTSEKSHDTPTLSTISGIFGGGELLES